MRDYDVANTSTILGIKYQKMRFYVIEIRLKETCSNNLFIVCNIMEICGIF